MTVIAPNSVGVAAPDSNPATKTAGASNAGAARKKARPISPLEARSLTGALMRPVTAIKYTCAINSAPMTSPGKMPAKNKSATETCAMTA